MTSRILLPLPRPIWSFRKHDLEIAEINSKIRKGSAKASDFARIEELRPRISAILQKRRVVKSEINKLAASFGARMQARSKEDTGEDDTAFLDQERQRARKLREEMKEIDAESDRLHDEVFDIRLRMPNFTHPKVPQGGEEKAVVIAKGGDSTMLDGEMRKAFEDMSLPIPLEEIPALSAASGPDTDRDHQNIASEQGWISMPVTRLLNGSSWPLLFGPLALLEHALVRYAMEEACKANFSPVVVPDTIRRDILNRTGFSPRDGGGGQIFWLKEDGTYSKKGEESSDDLALTATAEIPLAGLCAGHKYKNEVLPKQYVATSHAFRAEAGARGLESRGLYRVHQFTKVEMFVVCQAEDSEEWLERLRGIQQSIVGGLGVPFRVLDMPTEELGSSAYRKYDIEAWMPGRGSWGEISSASNCTEYQARRLSISYTANNVDVSAKEAIQSDNLAPGLAWAHTLNGTAVAVPRLIVALLENYGVSSSGKIRLPAVLKKHWMENAKDQVEWIGDAAGTSTRQRAVERVRKMAKSSGTDPASMVVSFFVLHELTAILPLILIFYLLEVTDVGDQVMNWLLEVSETGGEEGGAKGWLRDKINEGALRAEKFGRRKGYFGFEEASSIEADGTGGKPSTISSSKLVGTFANAVAAYAITKALFPLRIGACIALAGPFARVCIEPIKRIIRRRAT
ncbi:hypothetical protein CBS101457_006721 [Exobasidium rhododendri]|nr:hypothetical protein CBS101457_006721 [Exobasidium rhododendri]